MANRNMLVLKYSILFILFNTWTKCSLSEVKEIYNSTNESPTSPVQGWMLFDEEFVYSNGDTVTWLFNANSGNIGPEYIVCPGGQNTAVNKSLESNWLVTNYYTSEANAVHIRVGCRNFLSFPNSPDCLEAFTIHTYESDSPVNVSEYLDQFVDLETSISPDGSTLLAIIDKSKKRGFYIAFHNTGDCVGLTSFLFYYEQCPSTQDIYSLPETPVPRVSEEPTVYNLSCPVGSVSLQRAECYSNGSWRIPEYVECVCERGWNEVASSPTCVACPENSYKKAFGNDSECVACPEMSGTNGSTGSVLCGCDVGWYRSEEESVDLLCGRSPSAVRNVRLERGTTGSGEESSGIRVAWDEPVDVWNRSVSYNVSLYSDGLRWSGRSGRLWYELTESELGRSNREYLLEVTSLNSLAMLSGVENSVSVRFVSAFPEVVSESLRLNGTSSELEWEYQLEGGVSELRFELNYTSIGGVTRQETVNGCSPVSTVLYKCSVAVFELNVSIDIVLTLLPLSPNGFGGKLYRRINLSTMLGQGIRPTNSTLIDPMPNDTITTIPPFVEIPLVSQTAMYLIFSSFLLLMLLLMATCLIVSLVICCFILKKRILKIFRIFPTATNYATVDDTTINKTRVTSYQNPDMFANLREAVRQFAKEVNNIDIKIEHVIGNGEFGDVCKGTLNQDGHLVAVALKTLKPDVPEKHKSDFYREASVMGQFDNENIIRLLGVTLQHPIMIITPFMSNGSLDLFLRNHKQGLSFEQQGNLALGVASGMVYLSSISFVHRDLAARNVLVAHDMTPKIIDFGLSRETEDIYTMSKGGLVAVRWTALEAILYKRFSSASDVWSFGILLWEIMSFGAMPYEEIELMPLVQQLQGGYRMPAPPNSPEQISQLMSSCWLLEPDQRPNFVQVHSSLNKLIESEFRVKKTNGLSASYQANQPSCSSVREWLATLQMDRYEDNFTENGYTSLNRIWRLNQPDLLRIGIIPSKHRNKIMTSIRKTNQVLVQDEIVTESTRV